MCYSPWDCKELDMREPSGEKRGLWNRGGSFSQPLSHLYYPSKGHWLTPDAHSRRTR